MEYRYYKTGHRPQLNTYEGQKEDKKPNRKQRNYIKNTE